MRDWLKYILFSIGCIIAQIILGEFVNFHPLIYIAIFPLIVILMPPAVSQAPLMLLALCIGLIIDSLSDGVIGLNAAALIAVAYFKTPVISLLVNKNNISAIPTIGNATLGLKAFSFLCLMLYTIFFLVYMGLDGFIYVSAFYSVLRFLIYVLLNTLITILIEIGLSKQILQ